MSDQLPREPLKEPADPAPPARFLIRAIESVRRDGDAVDMVVIAVGYALLGSIPGLITTEPLADQGLEQRLPNLPRLDAVESLEPSGAGVSSPGARSATIRVRACSPRVLRMTLVPEGEWSPAADGMADGILVDPTPGSTRLIVEEEADYLRISTGELTLHVARRPFAWTLENSEGRVLTRSGGDRRQVAGFPLAPALAFGEGRTWASFELSPGEVIVGLGEQYGSVVHNGRELELVADDALGAGTGRVYKAVPLYHSTAGYSVFVHSPGPMTVHVGYPFPSLLEIVNEEPDRLDLFLLGGTDLKSRLTDYVGLTGRMTVPPRWGLGVWMSRCRYRTREELEAVAGELRAREVPCDVLHVDPDWLERDLLNCDFVWSDRKYPDPAGMIGALHAQGFRLSLWELPYLDPEAPLYEQAARAGYLVRDAAGAPAAVARTFSRDGRPRGLVDFSNPTARSWWKELNRGLLDLGVDVIKCDFGEGLPDDARMADGRTGRSWRNLYPLWYNRTVAESVAEVRSQPLIWSRSGWAGSQRYPAQWGGDPEASVAGLAAELRAGISWGLSAPGLWGHDIGGFYGHGPSPELYIRWAQVGCLSPLTRFHGLTPREPWAFGERSFEIVCRFIQLRYRLLPYLESVVIEAARWGWPVMRGLGLEFPDDPLLWSIDHEYLLGPDLLVVAVLSESPDPVTVEVRFPEGTWCDFWTGRAYQGPGWFSVTVDLDRLPLFVRNGAVIPMGPGGNFTDAIPDDVWDLHCWWAGSAVPPLSSAGAPAMPVTTNVHAGSAEYSYTLGGTEAGTDGDVHIQADEPVVRARSAFVHGADGRELPVPVVRVGPR